MTTAAILGLYVLAAAPPPVVALAIAPDGSRVVTGSQAGVQVRSLPELAIQRSLTTELVQIHDLSFSPDAMALAVAGGSPADQGSVEIWAWPDATRTTTLPAGGDVAYRVAWNADGSLLAIAGGDKKVRVQSTHGKGAKTYDCHSAAVLCVLWPATDNLILSAGVDQSIRVLDPATGNVRRSLDNHTAAIRDLAARPGRHDGPATIASCSADRTVRFWQPAIGRLVRFVRLPSAPTALCWTPGGSHVLAACEDGRLRAIDPTTVEVTELATRLAGRAHAVAALPSGAAALLAGERGELRIVPLDAIKP